MITIDMIDEYVSEHEKQAAPRQADRPVKVRGILSSILLEVSESEANSAHFTRALDCALSGSHVGLLFWSRG